MFCWSLQPPASMCLVRLVRLYLQFYHAHFTFRSVRIRYFYILFYKIFLPSRATLLAHVRRLFHGLALPTGQVTGEVNLMAEIDKKYFVLSLKIFAPHWPTPRRTSRSGGLRAGSRYLHQNTCHNPETG